MVRKPSETVQLKLRFSEDLRRKLEKAAERNAQSMNAEIIARLEESFRKAEVREVVREEMTNFLEALDPVLFNKLKKDANK
ncbi:Arc family DNA-binding protein [Bradyrhizobium japonicum]|uniref:Arc family DNA-binding protein n=1 Tax=Bradyrhizobium japonicum TaxID=375 RepID=UPI001BADB22F|nr:Arc family DNA-binding protein [Bradyrhizobium japonicum]MBR0990017.1 Arc family DNA-binding protein [Bradyrhizobium japonicum]